LRIYLNNSMKSLLSIPLFTALFACNTHLTKTDQKTDADLPPADSVPAAEPRRPMQFTANDVMIVVNEISDTLKYTRAAFKEIVDAHPELLNETPKDPDTTYFALTNYSRFGGEAGQDEYYMLYAYFLKKKNGVERYAERRNKLIGIYLNINSIFGELQYGGTYFGHQYYRITGYAEFSVYLYKNFEPGHQKTYDISKEKDPYIESLRQLIAAEIKMEMLNSVEERMKRAKGLNALVDIIDSSITDDFYLRQAQEFQNRHYGYY